VSHHRPLSERLRLFPEGHIGAEHRDYRTPEWYGFQPQGLTWLKERGCEWVKVNADPGDLIVCTWYDSLNFFANDIPLTNPCMASVVQGILALPTTTCLQRESKSGLPPTPAICQLRKPLKKTCDAKRMPFSEGSARLTGQTRSIQEAMLPSSIELREKSILVLLVISQSIRQS
jgi:hypothetical protein